MSGLAKGSDSLQASSPFKSFAKPRKQDIQDDLYYIDRKRVSSLPSGLREQHPVNKESLCFIDRLT